MFALTSRDEQNILSCLLDRFALVFDGQTTFETHYFAVFEIFLYRTAHGYSFTSLSLSPVADEIIQDAEDHVTSLQFVLEVF